jgi:hypothetical protein
MKIKKSTHGGEMASSECSKHQSKKIGFEKYREKKALLYVKYRDHVLFRNCNSSEMKPIIREVVGWLTFENTDSICTCYDKPVDPLPNETRESGFIILKSDVLEACELIPNAFKHTCITSFGQKALKNGD